MELSMNYKRIRGFRGFRDILAGRCISGVLRGFGGPQRVLRVAGLFKCVAEAFLEIRRKFKECSKAFLGVSGEISDAFFKHFRGFRNISKTSKTQKFKLYLTP